MLELVAGETIICAYGVGVVNHVILMFSNTVRCPSGVTFQGRLRYETITTESGILVLVPSHGAVHSPVARRPRKAFLASRSKDAKKSA